MPQKVIKFKGINRKINEFHTSGECEELINLRPETHGGHSVVRQKRIVRSDVPYVRLYDHSFGNIRNIIAITADGRVDYIEEDGGIGIITDALSGMSVGVVTAGAIVVIYASDTKTQLVFRCENGRYEQYNVRIKNIRSVSIDYDYIQSNPASNTAGGATELTSEGLNEALNSAASGFYRKFPNGLCGAAVVGCTYELEDGLEIWSTGFVVANVTRCTGYRHPNVNLEGGGVIVYGASKVTLKLELENIQSENIKKINVYASRPVLPYEGSMDSNSSITIKSTPLNETNLGKQLMYYQGSVAIDKTTAELVLDFGDGQLGESVMEVTSGCIERLGNIVSYNNRFHYYNSDVNHIIQIPTVSNTNDSVSHWISYVKINDRWRLVNKVYAFSESVPNDFIYPMSGIKQIAFVKGTETGSGEFSSNYDSMFYVDLRDSASYNYSYAFDVTPNLVQAGDFEDKIDADNQLWGNAERTFLLKNEANAINVSAQYNPYVFPVEYSYSFTGEILDIATSYLPISSTQVGQYPLTVFTTAGVYALEQGSGSVLYSNITPLKPLVATGKPVSTPHGTFFMSSRDLYLLSGRDSVCISQVLDGDRDIRLRNNHSYQTLCCEDGYMYNFSKFLSQLDFRAFAENSVLTYDQLNNELCIGSTLESINYSYVFNLTSNTFHKISRKYLGSSGSSRYAIEVSEGNRSIVDMHNEIMLDQAVMLQSRPMSLEAAYTHIQRLVLLTDAYLTGDHHLCVSVFGSDNLYDWKCIISARKHDVALRHIRTNKSAKSYRDYVVLISGYVSTDTDISDIIADYTVVQRRLG